MSKLIVFLLLASTALAQAPPSVRKHAWLDKKFVVVSAAPVGPVGPGR